MGEKPELYRELDVKARKEHQCYACFRKINKKEKYVAIDGKWNGEFDHYKMCTQCNETYHYLYRYLLKYFDREDACLDLGYLASALHSLTYDFNDYHLARIYVCVKRRWKRFDGTGLMKPPKESDQ